MSPEYRKIKAEILATVESIRAAMPEAAAYLEEHLVFDDDQETFMYTGDDRIKLRPIERRRHGS
jgi:hypothetical protein